MSNILELFFRYCQYSLKKEFQSLIVLFVLLLSAVFCSIPDGASIIQRKEVRIIIPLLLGLFVSTHFSIEYVLDYFLRPAKAYCFYQVLLTIGLFTCNIFLAEMWDTESAGSYIAFVVLQIQTTLILLGLNLSTDFHLRDAMEALYLGRWAYFFLLLLHGISTIGYVLVTPTNKRAVEVIVLLLSSLSQILVVTSMFAWVKYYRVLHTEVLNFCTFQKICNVTLMATLCIVYSTGIILYSVALIFPSIFNIQKMSVMMTYLNCICVYIALLHDGIVTRIHFIKVQVLLDPPHLLLFHKISEQETLSRLQGFMRETAHEIRTPMNTVALGFQIIKAELLETPVSRSASNDEVEERREHTSRHGPKNLELILQMVDDTKASADIAVDLVSDLLLYDRLEEGGLQLARTPLKLWTLVKENMALFNIQVIVGERDYDCAIRSYVIERKIEEVTDERLVWFIHVIAFC